MKGYRTVVFNCIMMLVAIGQTWGLFNEGEAPSPELVESTINNAWVVISAVWAAGNVALRAVTNTSIGSKD